ncbi:hypothetical protein ACIBEA_44460 [Streptomyces sp. NPDC051555]|uniref:hypothetical protein n=1 Tax=Streptomyces sp. NPDC051555 TaxID=3365657 RepID=UPI0037A22626
MPEVGGVQGRVRAGSVIPAPYRMKGAAPFLGGRTAGEIGPFGPYDGYDAIDARDQTHPEAEDRPTGH